METWTGETFLNHPRQRSPVTIDSVAIRLDNPPKKEAKSVPPALVWAVNMVLVMATPVIFVYGTVLPLLAETIPYLASKFPTTFDVTLLLQLMVVGWLLLSAWDFYGLQGSVYMHYRRVYRQGHYNKWGTKRGCEALLKATLCDLCHVYVTQWRYHSLVLNACVCRGDWYESALKTLLTQWKMESVALLIVVLLEAALGGPVRLSQILLLALSPFAITYCRARKQAEVAKAAF